MTISQNSHSNYERSINGSRFRRAGVASTGIVLSLALAGVIVPSPAAADRVVDSASLARVSNQASAALTGARSAPLEGTAFRAAVDEAVAIATEGWQGPERSALLNSAVFDRAVFDRAVFDRAVFDRAVSEAVAAAVSGEAGEHGPPSPNR